MALQLIALSNPNLEFPIHRRGEKNIIVKMGHASNFPLVGIANIVMFGELQIVNPEILKMRIWIFLGVVDELVFVVVEVVLSIGVRESVFEYVTESFGLAVEVEEVDICSIADGEEIFVAWFETCEFGLEVEG